MAHELNQIFAENLIRLRKEAGLTQADLAEKLNYSDKSVSKWERGDGLPDLPTAVLIARLFQVSLDALVSKETPSPEERQQRRAEKRRVHIYVHALSTLLPFLVAAVIFFVLRMAIPSVRASLCILPGVIAASIVSTVFSCLWWGRVPRILSVSVLCWSSALLLWILLGAPSVFIIAGILQVLTVIWFMMLKKRK